MTEQGEIGRARSGLRAPYPARQPRVPTAADAGVLPAVRAGQGQGGAARHGVSYCAGAPAAGWRRPAHDGLRGQHLKVGQWPPIRVDDGLI